MKIKLFLSCLAFLAVIVQTTSSVAEKKDSVTKYLLKLSKGPGEEYDEEIEIDTEEETETFHVPKTSPDDEAGDIVYDFKKQMTMIRLPAAQACYLTHSTDDALKPADLMKALELVAPETDGRLPKARTDINLTVVGTLEDRSELGDEMAHLCAKLPVYEMVKGDVKPIDLRQTTDPENVPKALVKRSWRLRKTISRVCRNVCNWVTRKVCSYVPDAWGVLRRVCRWVGQWVCRRVCKRATK